MVQKKKSKGKGKLSVKTSAPKSKTPPPDLTYKTPEDADRAAEIAREAAQRDYRLDPMVEEISARLHGVQKRAEEDGTAELRTNAPADPAILMFTVQLALNAGNAPEAGRAMGWTAQRARSVVKKWPVLADIARDAAAIAADSVVSDWKELNLQARNHLKKLAFEAEDERVQLNGTLAIIERAEGKVPAKIEVEDTTPKDVWASIVTRFATSYHVARNVPFAEAMAVAEANPELVQDWARKNGLAVA